MARLLLVPTRTFESHNNVCQHSRELLPVRLRNALDPFDQIILILFGNRRSVRDLGYVSLRVKPNRELYEVHVTRFSAVVMLRNGAVYRKNEGFHGCGLANK